MNYELSKSSNDIFTHSAQCRSASCLTQRGDRSHPNSRTDMHSKQFILLITEHMHAVVMFCRHSLELFTFLKVYSNSNSNNNIRPDRYLFAMLLLRVLFYFWLIIRCAVGLCALFSMRSQPKPADSVTAQQPIIRSPVDSSFKVLVAVITAYYNIWANGTNVRALVVMIAFRQN